MLGLKFARVSPTTYVIQYRGGKAVREGVGLSFVWCTLTDTLAVIPVGSRELPFIYEEVTGDFQYVTVQGQVTFRVSDPGKMAEILNYTLKPSGVGYASDDPEKLEMRILNAARVLSRKELQELELKVALKGGDKLAAAVMKGLAATDEITSLGVEVMGLSILAIRPNSETARALEAQTREEVLKAADEAIYARRNSAVEQERAIRENELDTEIAIEEKKRQIRETQMDAEASIQARRFEIKDAEMRANTELEEKNRALVALKTGNAKEEAEAKAYAMNAMVKSFQGADPVLVQALASSGMEPGQLIALAFQALAGKAEKIGQLNISPDLLRELMAAK